MANRDFETEFLTLSGQQFQEYGRIAEILNELRVAHMNEDSHGVSECIGRIGEIVRDDRRAPFRRTTKTIARVQDGGEDRG